MSDGFKWSALIPILYSLASGAVGAYVLLRLQGQDLENIKAMVIAHDRDMRMHELGIEGHPVLSTRIDAVDKSLVEHIRLSGHPGVIDRINALEKSLDHHEAADLVMYSTGLGGRIDRLEERVTHLERFRKEANQKAKEELAKKGVP